MDDAGVVHLLDADIESEFDAGVSLAPEQVVLRVDRTGSVDWVVDDHPADSWSYYEKLARFDDRLFTVKS